MTSRLQRNLMRQIGRASEDFGLIEPGDRIMVGVSGGKDSYSLLWLLREIQRKVPWDFSIIAVNLDQGHPGFPGHILREFFETHGFEYRMVQRDTYSIVLDKVPEGKTYCSMCSRLRRGILYDTAVELGCNKIALGHHRDDTIETLMLNLLYAGQTKAMPPKLRSDDGRNIVIRPMMYCAEEELTAYAAEMQFPILPCDLCGSQENLYRKRVKRMLAELQADNPNVKSNLLSALGNIRPSHMLDRAVRAAMGVDDWTAMDEGIARIDGSGLGCGAEAK
jgi:tRNA 2-thiocytidine biosynthesis protein TtcA